MLNKKIKFAILLLFSLFLIPAVTAAAQNTSFYSIKLNVANFTFASADYAAAEKVSFNTTEPNITVYLMTSMNIQKISGDDTNQVWIRVKIDGTPRLEEKLRTVSDIGEEGSTGTKPFATNVTLGAHNITLEFKRTGDGAININDIDVNLGQLETVHRGIVRGQLTEGTYTHSSTKFSSAFNWTITKTIASPTFIVTKDTLNASTSARGDYYFKNLKTNISSFSWSRWLSDSTDVGSVSGNYIDIGNTSHNHTIASRTDTGKITVNHTIINFDLADNNSNTINYINTTNTQTNTTHSLNYSEGTHNIANASITIRNGTTFFMAMKTSSSFIGNSIENITAVAGTLTAGNITSVEAIDGDIYTVTETTTTPGADIRASFANISEIRTIKIYAKYQAGTGRSVRVEIYDFSSSSWSRLGRITSSDTFAWHNFSATDTNFISNENKVNLRIQQNGRGNPSRKIYIDQIKIQDAVTTTYSINATGLSKTNCFSKKERYLSSTSDIGNTFIYTICEGLTVGSTYTFNLWLTVPNSKIVEQMDESLIGFETTEFANAPQNLAPIPDEIIIPSSKSNQSGTLNITWRKFTDPNEDTVTYNVSLYNEDNSFNQTINTSTGNLSQLFNTTTADDGNYIIYVTACDPSNACSNSSVNFTIDNTLPAITLNYPPNGSSSQATTFNFNWSGTDNIAVQMSCNLTLDNTVQATLNLTNGSSANYLISGLGTGTHYWNVSCTDSAGNTNTSLTYTFIIESPPSGGSKASRHFCNYIWQCTDWKPKECPPTGIQTRTCKNAGNCQGTAGKPEETKKCEYSPPPKITGAIIKEKISEKQNIKKYPISEKRYPHPSTQNKNKITYIAGIFLILITIITLISIMLKNSQNKKKQNKAKAKKIKKAKKEIQAKLKRIYQI